MAGVLLTVVTALILAGCGGGSDGPGSYVGKASNAVLYVSWTRSKDSLSGQLTQARAADDPSNGSVDTERVGFDGTVDGSSVTLRLDEGLGSTSTLTGALHGKTLALDYPGRDGAIVTVRLASASSTAFNRDLDALRAQAGAAKQRADEAAARQQARDDAAQLAEQVANSMAGLDETASNATANGPDLYQSDLDTVSSDLDTVKSSYEVVSEDVANGYTDTICDDAHNVSDDVGNMKYDIGSMHGDVKSTSDPSVLARSIHDLRAQFAQLGAMDPSLLPAGAPTRDDVEAAIAAARRKVRYRGGRGANFTRAQALLAQAQAIAAKAQAACNARGG